MNWTSALAASTLAVLNQEAGPEAQDVMRQRYGIQSDKMTGS